MAAAWAEAATITEMIRIRLQSQQEVANHVITVKFVALNGVFRRIFARAPRSQGSSWLVRGLVRAVITGWRGFPSPD
jgi:hypothetical protein